MVVGPLAASTINLQLNLSALSLLTDFSKAAGTKISLNYKKFTILCKLQIRLGNIQHDVHLECIR